MVAMAADDSSVDNKGDALLQPTLQLNERNSPTLQLNETSSPTLQLNDSCSPTLQLNDSISPTLQLNDSCSMEDLSCDAIPTPYRKHSSGDLHSRLKTRKLLGVGETDDGDVHRSKLSQILGHSEQLYTRLPKGLRIWQLVLALMFSVMAIWALIFPKSLFTFALHQEAEDTAVLPVRLYGGALLSFSIVFWSTLQSVDKEVIRWALVSSVVYFTVQILVTSLTLIELGEFLAHGPGLILHRLLFGIISAFYYWCITDPKHPKNRRSNSNQERSPAKEK